MSRCGDLSHVFNSEVIPTKLKLNTYKAAVCSLLKYGSEAWNLTEETQAKVNGVNARCLSRFTGKDAHQEASSRTRTYDLLYSIRKCRYTWLGHILRLPDQRLVKHSARVQHQTGLPGNMFMDAPPHGSFDELVAMAKQRKKWKRSWSQLGVYDDFVYTPTNTSGTDTDTTSTNNINNNTTTDSTVTSQWAAAAPIPSDLDTTTSTHLTNHHSACSTPPRMQGHNNNTHTLTPTPIYFHNTQLSPIHTHNAHAHSTYANTTHTIHTTHNFTLLHDTFLLYQNYIPIT
jgi:hypothetical protein